MENISLGKDMIKEIETIHKMSSNELLDLWDDMVGFMDYNPSSTIQRKLYLLWFIYSYKNGSCPTAEITNKIQFYLECLEEGRSTQEAINDAHQRRTQWIKAA